MEKSLHIPNLGGGVRSNSFLRNIFQVDNFILEIARSSDLAGIIFYLRLEGKKRIRVSCFLLVLILRQTGSFSVTDTFLTLFYYVENEMES